ncbi:MAG: hypothetical protein WCS18_11555 [Sphaerochaetaceae bacterium]
MEYLKVVRNHQFPNGKVMVANELVTRNEATKRWGLAERDLESMPKVSAKRNGTYWFFGARFLKGETYSD